MKMKVLFASLLLAASGQVLAQSSGQVGGQVFDENGDPVVGAQIMVKGSKTGTVTDIDGKFSLPSAKQGETIVVTYLGMDSQTVKAAPGMKVNMQSQDRQLDEVIVVAYGEQKKSSFTGSAGVVKGDLLEKKQLTNVFSGLQGEVAGVQMTNTSGSPTATPSFAIRGFSSINAGTSPLIIVDGAPYDGGWNNLNPNDVESVTVLKDAASNALYGARGANGVIMITTKKGKAEKATISFEAKWSGNIVPPSITTASPTLPSIMKPITRLSIIIMYAIRACRLLMRMLLPTKPWARQATRADWAMWSMPFLRDSILSEPTAA